MVKSWVWHLETQASRRATHCTAEIPRVLQFSDKHKICGLKDTATELVHANSAHQQTFRVHRKIVVGNYKGK